MRILLALCVVVLVAGCESASPDSCKVVCSTDDECPSGQACGELGRCTAGDACPCTAGESLGCDGDMARSCNATADGIATQQCAYGCSSDAGLCRVCAPNAVACSSDRMMLEQCSGDGLATSTEACALGCLDANGAIGAHCGYIEPLYLPNACDVPAIGNEIVYDTSISLDTSSNANCSAIVMQTTGPEICVIRAPKITITATLTVHGARIVAFVADEEVLVQGTLDASANGPTSGPGGAAVVSGAPAYVQEGGGGAGFRFAGGDGGTETAGTGGPGGAAVDVTQSPIMIAGRRPGSYLAQGYPAGGGGGGGVMLVACRGDVTVGGLIDVGGGGGEAGRDTNATAGPQNPSGGAGGGTGGYLVFQGRRVMASATAAFYANGGGGGGGCPTDNCVGYPGQDGYRSDVAAFGGPSIGIAGGGGAGGTAIAPSDGLGSTNSVSPGGGGGSSGFLQTCVPAVGQVTNQGTSSPGFSAPRTISTR